MITSFTEQETFNSGFKSKFDSLKITFQRIRILLLSISMYHLSASVTVPVLVQGVQADKVTLTAQKDPIHYALNSVDNYKGQTKGLLTIKDNVDMIRLQKQLSNERTALLVIREKFSVLKQGQKSLQKNQGTLLEEMGQLNKQLKQEKQKVLILESGLETATISLHSLAQLQERVLDIEEERNLLKKSFNSLLFGTLSDHSHHNEHESKKESARQETESWRAKIVVLEKKLNDERSERENLEQVKKRILQEYETCQMEREQEKDLISTIKEKHGLLEQEVLQYRQNVKSLQEKLKRVSKAFRLQQESAKGLMFPGSNHKVQELSQELAGQQASHAETILELQKTRELLVMQQRLNSELQAEIKIEKKRAENEKEWRRWEVIKNEKLLKNNVLQIKKLQDQLRDSIYNYGNYNQIIPHQYRWTEVDQELVQMMEKNTILNQLQDGGSMLEISLTGATFTPLGLRLMRQTEGVDTSGLHELVTFCTYTFLDYEMHSTPLVSGTQPDYSFTSCFVLTGNNFIKLEGQGVFAHVEVHQALGGVRFRTQGRARIPLKQVLQHRGEKLKGRVNISGLAEALALLATGSTALLSKLL
ncbi:Protein fantom [Bagarius yarrelli]|uniref:Protein fantom n=1 Tax=Bagarius yarrelli TaxID=175774 RepID=A0A556TM64_BAGYA|nr:Protein fantom [Bagarius yarrelli]